MASPRWPPTLATLSRHQTPRLMKPGIILDQILQQLLRPPLPARPLQGLCRIRPGHAGLGHRGLPAGIEEMQRLAVTAQ